MRTLMFGKIDRLTTLLRLRRDETYELWEKLSIALCFSCLLILYVWTLACDVPAGDSGELITVAYLLGVAHPPGYPLFTMIGHLFSWLPFGTIAWRINLVSAVFSLGASMMIYLCIRQLSQAPQGFTSHHPSSRQQRWGALLGACFFACSPLVWEYSLKAEVFTLNAFFAALLLYLLICLRNKPSIGRMNVVLFCCGLSLTNHHTIIFFAPAVLIFLIAYGRQDLCRWRVLGQGFLAFVLGFLPYVYVPIRARAHPLINWDDAQSLQSVMHLFTRADYGTFHLMHPQGASYSLLEKWNLYAVSLFSQWGPMGLGCALFGLILLIRQRDRIPGVVLLLTYGLCSFAFLSLANLNQGGFVYEGIFERFYMLSLVIVAVWTGVGITGVCRQLTHKKNTAATLVLQLMTLSLVMMGVRNYSRINQHDQHISAHLGQNILKSVEPKALLIVYGDTVYNVLNYLQQIEGVRSDITVLHGSLLHYPWYCHDRQKRHPWLQIPCKKGGGIDLANLMVKNINQHPVYTRLRGISPSGYRIIPMGVLGKVVNKSDVRDHAHWEVAQRAVWHAYDRSDLTRSYSQISFEQEVVDLYATAWNYQEKWR